MTVYTQLQHYLTILDGDTKGIWGMETQGMLEPLRKRTNGVTSSSSPLLHSPSLLHLRTNPGETVT